MTAGGWRDYQGINIAPNGPSGNRTRVLGSEAQEDILYPMDPSPSFIIARY
jgi:hypothetical protein